MSDAVLILSDERFEQDVLQSPIPVLVDFWAQWCGPCKALAPHLEAVATDPNYTGKIKIAKLNVDDHAAMPAKYGIRGIPTLLLFKNGQIEATRVGSLSKSQLTAFIDEHIGQ